MKRIKFYTTIAVLFCMVSVNAQIGYQVSLLNSATGEPRANETVGVTIEITNSEGAVVCNETKSATTNEFGVLSLQVGSSNTFANMDWSKLPLYISATVDGVMAGRSQILTIPVAEAAKNLVNVDPDLICKTWTTPYGNSLTLRKDNTYTFAYSDSGDSSYNGNWFLEGNKIYILTKYTKDSGRTYYWYEELIYFNGKLYEHYDIYQ